MVGGKFLAADIVLDGGEQSAVIAELGEELVKQGGGRSLAVGAGHTHQGELRRRIVIESRGHEGEGTSGVRNADRGDTFELAVIIGILVKNCHGAVLYGFRDILVSVRQIAVHGYEQGAGSAFAGIKADVLDINAEF